MLITTSEAAKELLSHDDIMLICHASPDGDTLGSAFALYYALTSLGKRVRVCCSDELPNRFSYLYEGYKNIDFPQEYVVAVDVASTKLLGEKFSGYADKINLCIDHHPSNQLFAEQTLLDSSAAAACEIVFDVITSMGIAINPPTANCLYTGIATDTGCFKFSNTAASTHRIAAELFSLGAKYEEINRLLFETKSKRLVAAEQKALSSMSYFCDDRIAVIGITRAMLDELEADESELDGISALPRMIEGVEVGITIKEKPDGNHKVSLRTTQEVDASHICAIFGGGGHKRAAGCLIKENYETTLKLLIEAIEPFIL